MSIAQRAIALGVAMVAATSTALSIASPALADNCVSVGGNGVCSTGTTTLVNGGSTFVGLPSETVTSPTQVCYFAGCIDQGAPVATTPAVGQNVVLPTVGVPVGKVYPETNNLVTNCFDSDPNYFWITDPTFEDFWVYFATCIVRAA